MKKLHKSSLFLIVYFLIIADMAFAGLSGTKIEKVVVGDREVAEEKYKDLLMITRKDGITKVEPRKDLELNEEDRIEVKNGDITVKLEMKGTGFAYFGGNTAAIIERSKPYLHHGKSFFDIVKEKFTVGTKLKDTSTEGTKFYVATPSQEVEADVLVLERSVLVNKDGSLPHKRLTDKESLKKRKADVEEIRKWIERVDSALPISDQAVPQSPPENIPQRYTNTTVSSSSNKPAEALPTRPLIIVSSESDPSKNSNVSEGGSAKPQPVSSKISIADIINHEDASKPQSAIVRSKKGQDRSAFRNMKLKDGDQIMTRDASLILEADSGKLFYLLRNQTHVQLKQGRLDFVSGDAYYSDPVNAKIYAAEQWIRMTK